MAKKSAKKQKERLFQEKLVPAKTGSGELFDASYGDEGSPVECLGMTFENDEARRQHFQGKLRAKLQDPEFRKIEGFPIGEDEDILAMSDPPYYTACPNPFLTELTKHNQLNSSNSENDHQKEPFTSDVSEGKSDGIYTAHSYHTKVPYKAIMRYLLHYSQPGDVILDGFAGTGMTGVAAQFCGSRKAVTGLGLTVDHDGVILDESDTAFSRIGHRYCILNDLSPIAGTAGGKARVFNGLAARDTSPLFPSLFCFASTSPAETSLIGLLLRFLLPEAGRNYAGLGRDLLVN